MDVFNQVFVCRSYSCLDREANVSFILDCGANVGYTSAYLLSRFPQATVVAIEPDMDNFALLQENLRPYGNRAIAMRAAVWSHSTQLGLSDNFRDGREWSRCVAEGSGTRGTVQAFDIDTLLTMYAKRSLSILKMDIEGAERAVFRSNTSWVSKTNIIAVELHDQDCRNSFHQAIHGRCNRVYDEGELTVAHFLLSRPHDVAR